MIELDEAVPSREQIGTYVFVVVLSAFLGELLIMVALEAIRIDSAVLEALIDAGALSLVVLTVTWHSMLRPFLGALRTLKRSRTRYRSVIDAAGDMVFVVDDAGCIKDSNRTVHEVLETKGHELVGRHLSEFLQDDQGRACDGVSAPCCTPPERSGSAPQRLEGAVLRRDGTLLAVSLRVGRAERDVDGAPGPDGTGPAETIVLARDISERAAHQRSLEDRAALLQTAIDAIPAPIFFKDADFVYQGCNQAFEAFIGFDRKDIVGKRVRDVAPPELAETYHAADKALFDAGREQVYETDVLYADGSRHRVEFRKAVFRDADGAKAGIIGVMLDVTGWRKGTADPPEAQPAPLPE